MSTSSAIWPALGSQLGELFCGWPTELSFFPAAAGPYFLYIISGAGVVWSFCFLLQLSGFGFHVVVLLSTAFIDAGDWLLP